MPLAVFFVSVLISLSLVLSTMGIVKKANTDQASLAADAAYLASQSVINEAWSDTTPLISADVITDLQDHDLQSQIQLIFNQGIPVKVKDVSLDAFEEENVLELYERSAELSLINVSPDEILSGIAVDLCRVTDPCPEIVFEWFRFDKYFRFQDLSYLNSSSFDSNTRDHCVDLPALGVQRCVVRSSSQFLPSGLEKIEAGTEYIQSWRLRTNMASYDYLVRVWLQSEQAVWIRLSGVKSFPDGDRVALPQQLYTAESITSGAFSSVSSKETRRISAGLQDGLGFVHYADEVEDK